MRVGLHRLMLFMMMIPIISRADNILTVHDTTVIAGDTAWIHVSLDNDEDVVGFQFDLSFPSMLDYTGVADLSARGSGHSLEVNANGPYLRFMAYNLDLTPFSGNEGTLLTIGFETEQPYGDYAINLLDPVLGNDESDNILSGHSNGMLTLASPEPQLTAFAQVVIGEDSSFVISLDSLQAHVHDANTPVDELTWSLNADHLTITSSGNDHVVIPDENWFGRDTIIITVSDGIYQDDTVMPVRVLNVNDLPTLVSDIPDQSLSEDETLSLDLGNYFIDVDGQLNFGITDHDENCQVSLVDQILTMEPDTNWFGSGIISIYATDLLDTVGTSFNFVVDPVNDPVFSIMDLDPVVILEDSSTSVILSGHFQDIDSELTFTASSDSLNLTTIVEDTMLMLVPDQNWFGTTMIHVTAGDGQYESSLSFSMSVLAVNDPPIQTDSIFIHPMYEDSELMIILGPYFSDVDSDITYGAQSSVGQVSVSVSSDTLVIDPQADWHGQATISITYQDQEFTNLTDLELQVMPVNDPPTRSEVIADQSILEDSDLELDMDDHFIDIDSELFFTVDELDDIDLSFDGSELLVSPHSDWNGTRYVFVTASDLEYSITDTFLLTVNAVNDPPDPVTLSYPLDGSEVESLDVTLDWQEPFDVDSDVVYTTLYLQFNGGTMSYGLDTIGLTFNVVEMQMPYDDPITWWISVTDGLLYTTSDTHEFTVPSDIRFNGPLWTISKDGDDVISDGSSRYPFPRIQQGMSSANNGDTVLVTPGTFNETIDFLGKNIVVSSRFMMDGDTSHIRQTIIDGGGTDRCVYFSNDEGDDALLHGMTIQNGYAYNGGGGGIHIQGASPRIQRCVYKSRSVDHRTLKVSNLD